MVVDILDMVLHAGKKRRSIRDFTRKVIKLSEETGELSEAFLGVTSKINRKHKKWEDVREEAIDVAIIALDIALKCRLPGDPRTNVIKWFKRKVGKWTKRKQKI
jgi:NTP pyrophosphatase (non-canonical NTP hydrolase)